MQEKNYFKIIVQLLSQVSIKYTIFAGLKKMHVLGLKKRSRIFSGILLSKGMAVCIKEFIFKSLILLFLHKVHENLLSFLFSVKCKISDVEKCEGEAVANNRKGKLIFFYEWNIVLKWKCPTKEDPKKKIEGKVNIPNLSEENEISEVDVSLLIIHFILILHNYSNNLIFYRLNSLLKIAQKKVNA